MIKYIDNKKLIINKHGINFNEGGYLNGKLPIVLVVYIWYAGAPFFDFCFKYKNKAYSITWFPVKLKKLFSITYLVRSWE